MVTNRWIPVAILLAAGPLLLCLQAEPLQTPTQTKSKASAKGKTTAVDTSVPGSTLGPGTWLGLIKDSPPSETQMIMAYHPQFTQGLPAPGLNQPAPNSKNAKTAAAALAKQKAAALQKLKADWKMVRFDLTESVPLHFFVLPEAFDEKGEILKPTTEQQDQLKKGGIPGKVQQLRPGMVVRVHQVQDGKRLLVDKVDVLREVPLDLPGLNEKPKATKAPAKKN